MWTHSFVIFTEILSIDKCSWTSKQTISSCNHLFCKNVFFVVLLHLAETISCKHQLQQSTSLWQHLGEISAQSSMQNFFNCAMFEACLACTASFKSPHSISIGYRSGLWPGHSITLCFFFSNHSVVDLLYWNTSAWSVVLIIKLSPLWLLLPFVCEIITNMQDPGRLSK